MVSRLFYVVALVVVSVGIALGAPKPAKSEKDLEKNIVEFLKQDKEFLHALERATLLGDGISGSQRHRRQTEIDGDSSVGIDVEQKEGFFDRAAKFVVDLLQRFLKWINSDNN